MKKHLLKVFVSLFAVAMLFSGCVNKDQKKALETHSLTEGRNPVVTVGKKYRYKYVLTENIIEGLEKVKGVSDITLASETDDPEDMINIGRGCQDVVYFQYAGIDQNSIDVEDEAYELTLHGGSIEIYETPDFAEERSEELLENEENGMHYAYVGCIIFRLSKELGVNEGSALAELSLAEIEKLIEIPEDLIAYEESLLASGMSDQTADTQDTQSTQDTQDTQSAQDTEPSDDSLDTDTSMDAAEPSDTTGAVHQNDGVVMDYICNLDTLKFHHPDCESVELMNEDNKLAVTDTRNNLIDEGYEPCLNCTP